RGRARRVGLGEQPPAVVPLAGGGAAEGVDAADDLSALVVVEGRRVAERIRVPGDAVRVVVGEGAVQHPVGPGAAHAAAGVVVGDLVPGSPPVLPAGHPALPVVGEAHGQPGGVDHRGQVAVLFVV